MAFNYSSAPYAIRDDIPIAYDEYWQRLSAPGSWWTGAERVAIAEEVRTALVCEFCQERKTALSPNSVTGEHHSTTTLPKLAVDAVHRIITDQTRITQLYVDSLVEGGISKEQYVELAGIAVTVFSIDEFNRALGIEVESLPDPLPGEPSGYRPERAAEGTGFVPMLPRDGAVDAEADLWPNGFSANVLRAFSSVPDAVRHWMGVAGAQYLSMRGMANFGQQEDRSINRMQMELVAGRVSAVNECFY